MCFPEILSGNNDSLPPSHVITFILIVCENLSTLIFYQMGNLLENHTELRQGCLVTSAAKTVLLDILFSIGICSTSFLGSSMILVDYQLNL